MSLAKSAESTYPQHHWWHPVTLVLLPIKMPRCNSATPQRASKSRLSASTGTVRGSMPFALARFFALNVLENVIATRWLVLPEQQRTGIKNYVVQLVIKISADEGFAVSQKHFLTKLNETLVHIVKQELATHRREQRWLNCSGTCLAHRAHSQMRGFGCRSYTCSLYSLEVCGELYSQVVLLRMSSKGSGANCRDSQTATDLRGICSTPANIFESPSA